MATEHGAACPHIYKSETQIEDVTQLWVEIGFLLGACATSATTLFRWTRQHPRVSRFLFALTGLLQLMVIIILPLSTAAALLLWPLLVIGSSRFLPKNIQAVLEQDTQAAEGDQPPAEGLSQSPRRKSRWPLHGISLRLFFGCFAMMVGIASIVIIGPRRRSCFDAAEIGEKLSTVSSLVYLGCVVLLTLISWFVVHYSEVLLRSGMESAGPFEHAPASLRLRARICQLAALFCSKLAGPWYLTYFPVASPQCATVSIAPLHSLSAKLSVISTRMLAEKSVDAGSATATSVGVDMNPMSALRDVVVSESYLNYFSRWHPLSYNLLLGVTGAVAVFCTKVFAELVKAEAYRTTSSVRIPPSQSSVLQTWTGLLGALVAAITVIAVQEDVFRRAIALFHRAYILPSFMVVNSFLILAAGGIVLGEFDTFDIAQGIGVPVAVALAAFGSAIVIDAIEDLFPDCEDEDETAEMYLDSTRLVEADTCVDASSKPLRPTPSASPSAASEPITAGATSTSNVGLPFGEPQSAQYLQLLQTYTLDADSTIARDRPHVTFNGVRSLRSVRMSRSSSYGSTGGPTPVGAAVAMATLPSTSRANAGEEGTDLVPLPVEVNVTEKTGVSKNAPETHSISQEPKDERKYGDAIPVVTSENRAVTFDLKPVTETSTSRPVRQSSILSSRKRRERHSSSALFWSHRRATAAGSLSGPRAPLLRQSWMNSLKANAAQRPSIGSIIAP